MTNANWWARVVEARTQHDDLLPQRLWVLRKDGHEASIDLRAVPGVGRVATQAAIADTRPMFEAKAWE